jgi:hypothetical protein
MLLLLKNVLKDSDIICISFFTQEHNLLLWKEHTSAVYFVPEQHI